MGTQDSASLPSSGPELNLPHLQASPSRQRNLPAVRVRRGQGLLQGRGGPRVTTCPGVPPLIPQECQPCSPA